MTDREVAVAVRAVVKRFDAVTALRSVSVDVGRGEMFGVIGPDGAGKTTLLRLICGLLAPDEGSVRVFFPPRTTEKMKLFHEKMKARMPPTTMPGRASGSAI